MLDPFSALLSNGLGWAMEYFEPLREMLDRLAGIPDAVAAHAVTWNNMSGALEAMAVDLRSCLAADLPDWRGPAAAAYQGLMANNVEAIDGLGVLAATMSSATRAAGNLVSFTRDLVRDLIADLVARVIVWAAESLLVVTIPVVAAQITSAVVKWAEPDRRLHERPDHQPHQPHPAARGVAAPPRPRPRVRFRAASTASAALTRIIVSTGPAGPGRSSHSVTVPTATDIHSGSGVPSRHSTRPAPVTRTRTRRAGSSSRAGQSARIAAPRTIGVRSARAPARESKYEITRSAAQASASIAASRSARSSMLRG
nr:hypothetical protein GCM10020092_096410 [Actinoplanes digitatis]